MRYLGNKDSLLLEIENFFKEKKILNSSFTFFDAFSGTGAVSNNFKDTFKIIINDNLYSSYTYSLGRINESLCTFEKLGFNPITYFNKSKELFEGFISKNYAPKLSGRMYFSDFNANRIDFFRTQIGVWASHNLITTNEYNYLIACLLESVSKVANIAGVYGAYLKQWDPRALKEIKFISPDNNDKLSFSETIGYNKDLKDIIKDIECDILYLDPPYTKNKYTVQYHLLETISKYDNPQIKGITGGRDFSSISTNWSKPNYAEIELDYILANTKATHIVMSYSSDGIISKDYITACFKRYGIETTFDFKEIEYKKYRNTKTSSTDKHYEYLIYIQKKKIEEIRYTCPLNYMGGKTPIIDEIMNEIENPRKFIDLMGGGFNVGINVNSSNIIYNDYNHIVKNLVQIFKDYDTAKLLSLIEKIITKYKLEKKNKETFNLYRSKWNDKLKNDRNSYIYLYVLILYGFQQQLRFNSKLEFNNTCGESGFNESIKEKIISFSRRIKELNLTLYSSDFVTLKKFMDFETVVYVDPPYYITLGSYNDGKRGFKGWSNTDETRLYNYLDEIKPLCKKIIISNVIHHKEKFNSILNNWIIRNNLKYREINSRGRKELIIIYE